ncbi:phosphate ABC transporter, inner membrane subunit PstA [Methanoregula boonei 6A8]|jgi:phosphate transport system permease protein|uniref:Phosphate transport system permease protein PstA n=1 Tax=Methanoregula boonei (strain DSM 21154 / JCM 14090 / 6A8) TaxID=456442 RepID=A7IB21_METB6|nr:phosphate ABC transporter permease PstA [Methanoregula boonei]ABS56932.1 phosphate ABC transporter, inner membrane subunit PstA [Methanoregula boonei 6A8]
MTSYRREFTDKIIVILCLCASLVVVAMLFWIITMLFVSGLPSFSWYFITTPENAAGGMGNGIANAIVGTILISLSATIIAAPFGLGTAIYMRRYAEDNGITQAFRFLLEVLSGTPSIVIGIFGFLIFVIYMKQILGGFSLIAGAVALAILIMPVIERATEDAIDRVPPDLEEGSYALGASKWQTISGITIPTAFSGILTGFTLGFGRAAEESAVVILTAGYTQYMPEFGILSTTGSQGGVKVYPFQDMVATLPYTVYHSFQNPSLVKPSAGFAAAFVLVVIVFSINIAGKAFLSYGFGGCRTNDPSVFDALKKRLFPSPTASSTPISAGKPQDIPLPGKKSNFAETLKVGVGQIHSAHADSEMKKSGEPVIVSLTAPAISLGPPERVEPEPAPALDKAQISKAISFYEEDTPPGVPRKPDSHTKLQWRLRNPISSIRTRIRTWLQSVHLRRSKTASSPQPESVASPVVPQKEKTKSRFNLRDFLRPFLFTLIPFILVAGLLIVLAAVIPTLSPPGTGGVLDFVKSIVIAIVICAICAIIALFLLRRSAQILKMRKKNPLLGNRTGAIIAVIVGICLVLVGAFILSAHLFVPPVTTVSAAQEAGTSSAGVINTPIFSFNLQPQDLILLQKMNNPAFSINLQDGDLQIRIINQTITSMNMSLPATAGGTDSILAAGTGTTQDKSARLAAFLAQQNAGEENSVSSTATATPSPTVTLTPAPAAAAAQNQAVTGKYALDLGESYWYGDNSRPCLATVYNTSVLPFYFWWDMSWNRFVQQTPAQTGDVFLVIFIRIEDTGNMSALVPSADSFVVVNNGQTYTHNPYFDTSVLTQNEINYYSVHYDQLPYQWIREIGNQKRDYAFLTGFNVFGENTTAITTFTTNAPPSPGFDTNGQGYFIMPGRSNAIDGYLIYEVPSSVAADLKDTYVQVSFNSFSPAQWRLSK